MCPTKCPTPLLKATFYRVQLFYEFITFITMKKLILLLLFIPLVFSCGGMRYGSDAENKRFANNFMVNEGMTKQEVVNIMGNPVASEFDSGVEEFHYCKTGWGADDYVSFYFEDGKVISKTSYNVTVAEVGTTGHCSQFIKRGTYRTPDRVLEIRYGNNPFF